MLRLLMIALLALTACIESFDPVLDVPTCGNSRFEAFELCDDGNTENGDGCSATCMIEQGWRCVGERASCKCDVTWECDSPCECDSDCDVLPDCSCDKTSTCDLYCPCDARCPGAQRKTSLSTCGPVCGDGLIVGFEVCDDGNTENGDGCSSICSLDDCSNSNYAPPECTSCLPQFSGPNCNECTRVGFSLPDCNTCLRNFTGLNCDECAEGFAGVTCEECANPIFIGPNCDRCANGNFAAPNCTTCLPRFTGATCSDCSNPNYALPECTSCLPEFTGPNCNECSRLGFSPPDCDSCLPNFTGLNCDECAERFTGVTCEECANPIFTGPNCDRCVNVNFAAPDCTTCLPRFTGETCGDCSNSNYAPPECTSCLPEFSGPNCNECSRLGFSLPDCTSCLPEFTGPNCDQCADSNFALPDCTSCLPEFTGPNCDTCADPRFSGTQCNSCAIPGFSGAMCHSSTCTSSSAYSLNCLPIVPSGIDSCSNESSVVPCPGNAGSNNCSSIQFCGQDAQYQAHNSRSLTCLSSNGQRLIVCPPIVSSGEIVHDELTNLFWQRTDIVALTWEEAVTHCENSTYAGLTDWRLPNPHELQSLLDYGEFDPAIDRVAFPEVGSQPLANAEWYWTNERYNGQFASNYNYGIAYYVDFTKGEVRPQTNRLGDAGGIHAPLYVRCVR